MPFVALSLVVVPALAVPIDEARRHFAAREFASAETAAESALSAPELTADQLAELYEILGTSQAVRNRGGPAEKSFASLLRIRPMFACRPDASPRACAAIEKARAAMAPAPTTTGAPAGSGAVPSPTPEAPGAARLRIRGPTEGRTGEPLRLSVAIVDPTRSIVRIRVHHRRGGTAPFSEIDLFPSGAATIDADVPAPAVAPPAVEAYAVAFDATGAEIAAAASAVTPASIPVRTLVTTRFYARAWVWGVAGAAVVAGAVAAVLVLSNEDAETASVTFRFTP